MSGEIMTDKMDTNLDQLQVIIQPDPIKALGEITLTREGLEKQADVAVASVVDVDYHAVRGTCGDERVRVGLRSGEPNVEARPSVFGGPVIYGLYVAELAGAFKDSHLTASERLSAVYRDLKRNGILAGGHEHCAAAGGFGDAVMPNIAASAEAIKSYAEANMGDDYEESLMDEVLANAVTINESGVYVGWDGEAALVEVLGDEADEAIEKLVDAPHEGRTLVRTHLVDKTVDQTMVHEKAGGEDSFVTDDGYAAEIENALATGPEADRMRRLMEHAREAVIEGVGASVPNPELHQIDIR
jgi:hypothetical protein